MVGNPEELTRGQKYCVYASYLELWVSVGPSPLSFVKFPLSPQKSENTLNFGTYVKATMAKKMIWKFVNCLLWDPLSFLKSPLLLAF